jgi:predicted Rossmann fold nucleotide-binding protein DprA/Smf involved in DNA uptake
MANIKIISGGQTGVDRAALDAALQSGTDCGGCCPEGRKAEDGVIPERYPLTELAGANYTKRTRQNVIGSDATVIIYFSTLSGGTEQTLRFCLNQKKPYLLIDASELSPDRTAERIQQFVAGHSITTLNIAGPRASGEPLAYAYALQAMQRFLGALQNSA